MKKENIELYSWVVRGTQRTAILKSIDKPKTPKQISQQTNIKFSNVSDVLRALSDKGLVICLNPKDKTGRLYELSKKGTEICRELG